MRTTLAFVVCLLCVGSAPAQTAAELGAQYGKPAEVYSVSEHVWMTPEFALDGQVCRMRLLPKRTDGATNYLAQKLPFAELIGVLNALVPVGQRGAKRQSFGATSTGGPAAWTTYGYEQVTFTFVSAFPSRKLDNSPPLSKGDFVFSSDVVRPNQGAETSAPAADDFRGSQSSATDIVTISWNNRNCASSK